MLKNLILPDALMTMNAEGLLKVLGKPALPLIDILVREAIQNSLDAALKPNSIRVDVSWQTTAQEGTLSNRLRKILGERGDISKRLFQRLQKDEQGMLLIRDSGTTGLTGATERKKKSEPRRVQTKFFQSGFLHWSESFSTRCGRIIWLWEDYFF